MKVFGLTSEEGLQLSEKHGIIVEVDPKDADRWVVSLDGMGRPKSFKATQLEKLPQEVMHRFGLLSLSFPSSMPTS